MAGIFRDAATRPFPAAASKFRHDPLRILTRFCAELQAAAEEKGGNRFYLSSYQVGRLMGVSHQAAYRWLRTLLRAKVIVLLGRGRKVVRGSEVKLLANLYKYTGD